MKYIVVTGGVVSGIGKGITISSIGRLLKSSGIRVTSIKIDPYLNVDAGTMSPYEHGETFVLDDGGETDLDLGNYERFLDITLTNRHNITTGKIYSEVISGERRGDYLGKTVQIVPHATDKIQSWIEEVAKCPVDRSGCEPDLCLIEVGGTVGDIESMVFLEALRQFQFKVSRDNIMFVHVSLVPQLGVDNEQKTKPTQHSVKELRGLGLAPDIIVCRSKELLASSTTQKMSVFCQVPPDHVVSVYDVSNIYHVPLILLEQGVHKMINQRLMLKDIMLEEPQMTQWAEMARIVDTASEKVTIAIVGKYTGLQDSYASLIKSVKHSAIHLNVDVSIEWIEASHLENETLAEDPAKHASAWGSLRRVAGIIVAGGFGSRGVEGKILAAKYAREEKKPYLGICLGMQVMVIEFARHVLGHTLANSTEFDEKTSFPAVVFMPEINPEIMGGTMRLGSRPTTISHNQSLASTVYGFSTLPGGNFVVNERHRHRYEVNPEKIEELEAKGLTFSGRDDTGTRMEIVEIDRNNHPFYFGTQFHPEFKSKPNRPSPPFFAFLAVSCEKPAAMSQAGVMVRESIQSGSMCNSPAPRALSPIVQATPTGLKRKDRD